MYLYFMTIFLDFWYFIYLLLFGDIMWNNQGNSRKRIPHFIDKLKEIDKTQNKEPSKYLAKLRVLARNELRYLGAEKVAAKEKLSKNSIRTYITDYKNAVKQLNAINPKAPKAIADLQKKYKKKYPNLANEFDSLSVGLPELRNALLELRDTLANERLSDALNDLKKIKIEHPIFYYLKLDAGTTEVLKAEWRDKLHDKHTNAYTISYDRIMCIIEEGFKSSTLTKLALALAFATGRRAVEILIGGEFKVVRGKNELTFAGQAKTKRDTPPPPFNIPVFPGIEAKEVMKHFKRFRQLSSVARLAELEDDAEKGLSVFDQVNRATASDLNKWTRYALRSNEYEHVRQAEYLRLETEGKIDKERMFKDARAIYARACLDKHFSHDLGISEEKYVASLLGHDEKDLNTQISYRGVRVDYKLPSWDEKIRQDRENEKLDTDENTLIYLTQYDDVVDAKRSKPMTRIHEWLKHYFANPQLHGGELPELLSRGAIRKACNANPKTVDKYLEAVELKL